MAVRSSFPATLRPSLPLKSFGPQPREPLATGTRDIDRVASALASASVTIPPHSVSKASVPYKCVSYSATTSRQPSVLTSLKHKVPPASNPPSKRSAPAKTSRTKHTNRVDTLNLCRDCLGALVRKLCTAFEAASSWEDFVNAFRGPSYLAAELDNLNHDSAELLRHY